MDVIQFRIYADGSVAHEDDFSFYDHSLPAYDFQLFEVPKPLLNYIEAMLIEEKKMKPAINDPDAEQGVNKAQ